MRIRRRFVEENSQLSASLIITHVLQFSRNATNVTLIGLAVLPLTVYALLVDRTGVQPRLGRYRQAPLVARVRLYAVLLALASVVTAISYAVTLSLGLVDEQPWLLSLLLRSTSLLVVTVFFAGLYFAVPNARVAARDALWAGLFAALGFVLMKKGFEFYLAYFVSVTLVYGAFATVPIFLSWLYLSWAVILLGALVAATLPEFRSRRRC